MISEKDVHDFLIYVPKISSFPLYLCGLPSLGLSALWLAFFLYSFCVVNWFLLFGPVWFMTSIPLPSSYSFPIFTIPGFLPHPLFKLILFPACLAEPGSRKRHSEPSELAPREQDDLANTTYPRNWIYKVNPLQPPWAVATANFIIVRRLMVETGLRLKKFRQINAPGWGLGTF